jgi:hypothetical protein
MTDEYTQKRVGGEKDPIHKQPNNAFYERQKHVSFFICTASDSTTEHFMAFRRFSR